MWSTILHLMGNSWFSRLWTVQEAALAQNITFLCGEHEIEFKQVQWAIHSATYLIDVRDEADNKISMHAIVKSIDFLRVRDIVRMDKHGLEHLFSPCYLLTISSSTARNQDCLRPKDRIFGLLGLIQRQDFEAHDMDLILDYTSIPDLYTRFSAYLLTRVDLSHPLWWEWLSLAFTFKRSEGLPSWVPDLHHQGLEYVCQPNRSLQQFLTMDGKCTYRASALKGRAARQGVQSGQLVLQGEILDEVTTIYPEICKRSLEWTLQNAVSAAEWEDKNAKATLGADTYETGTESYHMAKEKVVSLETYWRTLVGNVMDCLGGSVTSETYLAYRNLYRPIREVAAKYDLVNRMTEGLSFPELGIHDSDMEVFLGINSGTRVGKFESALWQLGDRQLFQTESGKLGFTIKGVQPGDVVCVFSGSPVGHVLRRASVEVGVELLLRFVGDAYVHDFMNGEADEMNIEEEEGVVLV